MVISQTVQIMLVSDNMHVASINMLYWGFTLAWNKLKIKKARNTAQWRTCSVAAPITTWKYEKFEPISKIGAVQKFRLVYELWHLEAITNKLRSKSHPKISYRWIFTVFEKNYMLQLFDAKKRKICWFSVIFRKYSFFYSRLREYEKFRRRLLGTSIHWCTYEWYSEKILF